MVETSELCPLMSKDEDVQCDTGCAWFVFTETYTGCAVNFIAKQLAELNTKLVFGNPQKE